MAIIHTILFPLLSGTTLQLADIHFSGFGWTVTSSNRFSLIRSLKEITLPIPSSIWLAFLSSRQPSLPLLVTSLFLFLVFFSERTDFGGPVDCYQEEKLSILFILNMPFGNLSISNRFSIIVTISPMIIQNKEVLNFLTTKHSAPKTV